MLYTERRWVELMDLITQLPDASRLTQAQLNDPEIAELILEAEDDLDQDTEWAPPLSEYGLTEQLLTQVVDGIAALNVTTAAAAGGKTNRPKPFPRPRTQVDIIRDQRSREVQADIISLFTPTETLP